MSSAFRRELPARPDLAQQRKLAKGLLAAFRAGDAPAVARIRAELPDKTKISLADAQFVLAREYGFPSWIALKEHIEARHEKAPVEQFKRAVIIGDAIELRRVLQRHAEARRAIDEPMFEFDATALTSAAGRVPVQLVDVLLEFGADPNRKSGWWAGGFHPLYSARGEVAERLLKAGAIPDACAAANLDDVPLLERMLDVDPARVNERGGDGQLPLHFARSRDVVDLLISRGADIDARDVDHRSTAAEWMVGREPDSRTDLARYLVERGAHCDIFLASALGLSDRVVSLLETDATLLNLRTGQGDYGEQPPSSYHIYLWTLGANLTPLQVASKFGHLATLEVMERFTSTVQLILVACNRGDSEAARDMVTGNPGVLDRLSSADQRALTDEAWAANAPAVEIMMELGFDPAVPSISGPTGGNALHCAAWQGSVPCVSAILRYPRGRALIDSRENTYGGTPLSWCFHGSRNCGNPDADHAEVARLLIEAGASLPASGEPDTTPAVLSVIRAARLDR